MRGEKKATSYPGVRYRENKNRKNGIRLDRYFFIRYKANGKDKEEGVGWATEGMTAEKASKILAEIRENLRTGKGPQSLKEMREEREEAQKKQLAIEAKNERSNVIFGKFFLDEYLPVTSLKKKPRSVETEVGLYKKWIRPVLCNIPIVNISYAHLETIINSMRVAQKSKTTIKYALAVISQVWTYAKNKELVTGDSPTKKFKITHLDNERTRFLTKDEAKKLLDALGEHGTDLKDIATLSIFCGLRAGEIFKLQWADVDMENGIICLRSTKAGNTRYAFFTEEVQNVFSNRIKANPAKSDLVFPSRKGEKRDRISKTFSRVVEKLGFNEGVEDRRQKVVFHTLRHTFASWLALGEVPLYNIQRLMGHSEARMVQRYAHLSNESIRASVNILNGALNEEKDQGSGKVSNLKDKPVMTYKHL